ncbi:sensor histidine kinase [Actinocorallia herbida]|nr:histidine kinase [Actinocorallia herbida]
MGAIARYLRRGANSAAATALLVVSAVVYPPVLFFSVHSGRSGFGLVEVAPSAVLTLAVLALVRRAPLFALAALLTAWTAAALEMPKPEIALLFAVFVDGAVAAIALTRPRWVSLTALGAAITVQLACVLVLADPGPVLTLLLAVAALAVPLAWLGGATVRQNRRHAQELAERAAAEAVAAERLRIARDLHDMVAHSIGVIAIQAGVGGRVIDTQPAEARNALAAIEESSRETLAGLRRMLGALRRADPVDALTPGLAGLDRLVRTTGDAGVAVDVRWTGERRDLPAEVDLAAFRIVQESVTNVVRHARTGSCRVSLGFGEEELVVEVADEGAGPSGEPAGYGLLGMRERTGLLGGSLTAGPRETGGFRVEARLPLAGTAR